MKKNNINKNERTKILSKDPKFYMGKWILFIFCGLPIMTIFSVIVQWLGRNDFYIEYYSGFVSNCLFAFAILCIFGALIERTIRLWQMKKYKMFIKSTIILLVFSGVMFKTCGAWVCENFGEFIQDYPYVKEKEYVEEVDKYVNIWCETTVGKAASVTIYVKTENHKFIVNDNIMPKKDFDSFKAKFERLNGGKIEKVKYVKIKYLPHTQILLSIEPSDEKDK